MNSTHKALGILGAIALSSLLASPARAADDVTAFATTEVETKLVFGDPGNKSCVSGSSLTGGSCWYEDSFEATLPYVLVDATEGKTAFPLEEEMRTFADEAEFVAFVEESLNGKAIYDEDGKLIAVEGESIELGQPSTTDGFKEDIAPVVDPIVAFLGGRAGAFKIGEDVFTLPSQDEIRDETEIVQLGSLPSSGTKCNGAQSDCIRGESFVTHAGIYHSAGSTTKQTVGGYREWSYFCWKGPIPWVCTGHTGSNHLFVGTSTFYPAYNGEPAFLSARTANRWNATDVTAKVWQIGVSGLVARASGACGAHSSDATGGSLATGSGRYDGGSCGSTY